MRGYITNIEDAAKENKQYRHVLYTAKNSQLVLMSLRPGEEIGEEVHELDQFIRFEEGNGKIILDGKESVVTANYAVLIPQGTKHNVINTGPTELKLYTIYSPPEHRDGTVHVIKAEADADDEHFDGATTE